MCSEILRNLSHRGIGFVRNSAPRQPRVAIPQRGLSNPSRYLSVVGIFKNEAPYLREWLEFHRLVGVEHAYLYDNGSNDGTADVLQRFVDQRFATLIPWALPWQSGCVDAQTLAYAHAITNFGGEWRWMAFIDVDEFLFPKAGEDLCQVLRDNEDLPALAVFWTMFGFCGNQTPPPGLVTENFTMRAPFPTHAKPKSIVNPAEVIGVSNPHLFDLVCGPRRAFTEKRQVFEKREGLFRKTEVGFPVDGRLRLNHYYTRSRSEFEEKVRKREASGRKDGNKLRAIAERLDLNPESDHTILRFVPELKTRLCSTAQFG
jgi:Glycosyltransferase family 92